MNFYLGFLEECSIILWELYNEYKKDLKDYGIKLIKIKKKFN